MLFRYTALVITGALLVSSPAASAATGTAFPELDVHRMCKNTVLYGHAPKELLGCRHDERAARDDLKARWTKIPAEYKRRCMYDPEPVDPSYVELQSCIDNNLYAANPKFGTSGPRTPGSNGTSVR